MKGDSTIPAVKVWKQATIERFDDKKLAQMESETSKQKDLLSRVNIKGKHLKVLRGTKDDPVDTYVEENLFCEE
jgi:hypothetical protein